MQSIFVIDTNLERRTFLYDVLVQFSFKVTTLPTFKELSDALKREMPTCIVIEMESHDNTVKDILKEVWGIDRRIKIFALVPDGFAQDLGDDTGSSNMVTYLKKDTKIIDMVPKFLEVLKEKKDEGNKVSFNQGVLIVEDERNMSSLLQRYLNMRGYKVDVASNGEEALFMIKADRPKVVVLDLMMPGMDGLIVLKCIKEISSSVEVIVISGVSDEKIIKEAAKLGAEIYLCKPFGLEKLEAAVVMGMVRQR